MLGNFWIREDPYTPVDLNPSLLVICECRIKHIPERTRPDFPPELDVETYWAYFHTEIDTGLNGE